VDEMDRDFWNDAYREYPDHPSVEDFFLLPAGVINCQRDVGCFADLFTSRDIYDWNVCDWFCLPSLFHGNKSPLTLAPSCPIMPVAERNFTIIRQEGVRD